MKIYLITNTLTGKYYVGKTRQTLDKRWKQHVYEALHPRKKFPRNSYFYNSIRKYSPLNFKIEILCECPDEKTANETEVFFIYFLGATKKQLGYNATIGGDGGALTEEARHKISKALLGKKRGPASEERKRKISEANKGRISPLRGRKLSEETKKKIKEARKGFSLSEEARKKISNSLKGRSKTPEEKAIRSKTMKGRPGRSPTQETRNKIRETLLRRNRENNAPESISIETIGSSSQGSERI